MLGLRFCARAFSSCSERGPLFIAVRGPLSIAASLIAEHGSRCAGSVVVAHGPSCSMACGILPDQGSNPCPLNWQADSQPLRHQGSPVTCFFKRNTWGCLLGQESEFSIVSILSLPALLSPLTLGGLDNLLALIFYFWLCHAACGILVPRPGIEPVRPAVEAWNLNHWTSREVPKLIYFFGHALWLAGSSFLDQGSNLGPRQ